MIIRLKNRKSSIKDIYLRRKFTHLIGQFQQDVLSDLLVTMLRQIRPIYLLEFDLTSESSSLFYGLLFCFAGNYTFYSVLNGLLFHQMLYVFHCIHIVLLVVIYLII